MGRLPFTCAVAALAAASACSSSSAEQASPVVLGPEPPPPTPQEIALERTVITDVTFSSGELVEDYTEEAEELEVTQLRSGVELTMTIHGTRGGTVLVDGVEVPMNEPHPFTIPRLGPDVGIRIEHRNAASDLAVQTLRTLPHDFPAYTVTVDDPVPGEIFITPYGWTNLTLQPYLAILDERGNPTFYKRTGSVATDFRWVTLPSGATRYVYYAGGRPLVAWDGWEHVLDEGFHELAALQLLPTDRHGARSPDAHDFLMLDDDHYVLAATIPRAVGQAPIGRLDLPVSTVSAAVLQEVKGGEVVSEWFSTDAPELLDESNDGNDYDKSTPAKPADYLHFNSIDVDAEGHWIVSLRHADELIAIDPATGETVWTLGGDGDDFGLTDEQKFSHQHYARVQDDGAILMFDNGNENERTRIVEVKVDPKTHAVVSYDAWDTGRYSPALGSVQKLDASTYFIGWGSHDDPTLPDVSEIDRATGKVRFSLDFLDDGYVTYRALKRVTAR